MITSMTMFTALSLLFVYVRVDESVQHNGEVNVAVIVDVTVEPIEKEDGNMVVNMKKAELTPLLAQDDKRSVPEIPTGSREKRDKHEAFAQSKYYGSSQS
jgi:hypothetical protein